MSQSRRPNQVLGTSTVAAGSQSVRMRKVQIQPRYRNGNGPAQGGPLFRLALPGGWTRRRGRLALRAHSLRSCVCRPTASASARTPGSDSAKGRAKQKRGPLGPVSCLALPRGLTRIAWGRFSPLRGAVAGASASKLASRVCRTRGLRLRQRNCKTKKGPRKAGPYFVWHSLGDSNPCYRRERAAS